MTLSKEAGRDLDEKRRGPARNAVDNKAREPGLRYLAAASTTVTPVVPVKKHWRSSGQEEALRAVRPLGVAASAGPYGPIPVALSFGDVEPPRQHPWGRLS